MQSPTIILASSSKYRATLLKQLGLNFEQISPHIDETRQNDEMPDALCLRLSRAKAEAVYRQHKNAFIIASDQVAVLSDNKHVLGKPYTSEKAIEQLSMCSGKKVDVYTGLATIAGNRPKAKLMEGYSRFSVTFRALTLLEIKKYVEKEQPLYSAGSFMVEGLGISLFERMEGDDYSSLIGLPLIMLSKRLISAGINPILL